MLSVKDIIFAVTVADLGFVGDTFVKLTGDFLGTRRNKFSLISFPGADELRGGDKDGFVVVLICLSCHNGISPLSIRLR